MVASLLVSTTEINEAIVLHSLRSDNFASLSSTDCVRRLKAERLRVRLIKGVFEALRRAAAPRGRVVASLLVRPRIGTKLH